MLTQNNRQKLISLLEHKNYQQAGDSFIIFPDNTQTMSQIVRLSDRFGIKIIVMGNGSTFAGPMENSANSVYLSTQRLNSVTGVDKVNMFAELQAGCKWKSVFKELAKEELAFPVKLESVDEKRTAGGIFSSLKPESSVSDLFTGIEFIISDGSILKFGSKTLKNVAGYDLVKFMAGSQGRFGIVTSLTLRLFPEGSKTMVREDLKNITDMKKNFDGIGIYDALLKEIDPNSVFA